MLEMLKPLEANFYRIIAALVILLVGLTLGVIIRKLLRRILHEFEVDRTLQRLGKNYPLEGRLSGLAMYLVYFLTLVIFFNQLGITSIVLYLLVGAVLLVISVALIIGVKDFIPNLIAGIIIYKKKSWQPGKKIRINGSFEGKIQKLGLLEMEIKTKKGDSIYVPNSLLTKSKVWLKR